MNKKTWNKKTSPSAHLAPLGDLISNYTIIIQTLGILDLQGE